MIIVQIGMHPIQASNRLSSKLVDIAKYNCDNITEDIQDFVL